MSAPEAGSAAVRAVLDANVLYPAPLRDTLLWLAVEGVYEPRWSDRIFAEWSRNLRTNRPDLDPAQLERTGEVMNRALPEAHVAGFEARIPRLTLPDPDDRHVLAVALHSASQRIVTFNLRDFPAVLLQAFGLEAQHPDAFVLERFTVAPLAVLSALRAQRQNLRRPPVSPQGLLDTLEAQGLPRTVAALRRVQDQL